MQYTFSGKCAGKTKTGKPCGQRSIYANGYCRHHGGNSTEYMIQHREYLLEKHRRRTARLLRKLGMAERKGNE